mmetsp:Transcript_34866/g.68638  ORF Transcript_34866/g.68638 Transcript_34866/m.68638 type:complete len:243 (-) Transcript_34866:233-961(-)
MVILPYSGYSPTKDMNGTSNGRTRAMRKNSAPLSSLIICIPVMALAILLASFERVESFAPIIGGFGLSLHTSLSCPRSTFLASSPDDGEAGEAESAEISSADGVEVTDASPVDIKAPMTFTMQSPVMQRDPMQQPMQPEPQLGFVDALVSDTSDKSTLDSKFILLPIAAIAVAGVAFSANVALSSKDAISSVYDDFIDKMSKPITSGTVVTPEMGCRGICSNQESDLNSMEKFMTGLSKKNK